MLDTLAVHDMDYFGTSSETTDIDGVCVSDDDGAILEEKGRSIQAVYEKGYRFLMHVSGFNS